jgi:hypothetical protein
MKERDEVVTKERVWDEGKGRGREVKGRSEGSGTKERGEVGKETKRRVWVGTKVGALVGFGGLCVKSGNAGQISGVIVCFPQTVAETYHYCFVGFEM